MRCASSTFLCGKLCSPLKWVTARLKRTKLSTSLLVKRVRAPSRYGDFCFGDVAGKAKLRNMVYDRTCEDAGIAWSELKSANTS